MEGPSSDANSATPSTPKRPRLTDPDSPAAGSSAATMSRHGRKRRRPASASAATSSPLGLPMAVGLDLRPEGVEWFPIQPVSRLPRPKLREFVLDIKGVANGKAFLPDDHEIRVRLASQSARFPVDWDDFGRRAFAPPQGRLSQLPGSLPPLGCAFYIFNRALDLQAARHDDARWIHEVHYYLLANILRGPTPDPPVRPLDVDITVATAATPHSAYVPDGVPAVPVDFLIYLDPCRRRPEEPAGPRLSPSPLPEKGEEEGLEDVIDHLRGRTKTASPNLTTFPAIKRQVMAVCVETKRQAAGGEPLQPGLWHAYHWKFLSEHARFGPHASSAMALEELGHIPGILIEGNQWYLIMSSRQRNGMTAIWSPLPIGRTDNVAGVYRIITAVRMIVEWATDVYWPWFVTHMLGI